MITEFKTALQRWALRDFDREIDNQFPLIQRLNSGQSIKVLCALRKLTLEDRKKLARHFVGRSGNRPDKNQGFSAEAESALKEFLHATRAAMFDASVQTQRDEAILALSNALIPLPKIRDAVVDGLNSLGSLSAEDSEVVLSTQMRWIKIETVVDFSKYTKLNYFHRLTMGKEILIDGTSLLHWLGIAAATEFFYSTEEQLHVAAGSLSELIRHFLKGMEVLVDDLGGK